MSVLNLPRFVFSGLTDWNPNTVNNTSTIYNEVTAEPVPQPGVPWNRFVDWLMQDGGGQPNGSWNVFGDHAATFMNDAGVGASITNIILQDGPAKNDPLIGAGVQILGLLFMDSATPAPARLVDVEPYGATSSQLFYESLAIGNAQLGVKGRGACRMFSRWVNPARNLAGLPIAGNFGVIWQTAVHNKDLQWSGVDKSPALVALKKAAEAGGNHGIVIQFASYRTLYYQTASYQGQRITNGDDLVKAYQNGFRGGNPARSILLGMIGIWGADELASAPTERLLAPAKPIALARVSVLARMDHHPGAALSADPQPVALAPAMALMDPASNVVRVNFIATFPEKAANLQKADLGTLVLQAVATDGTITQIGQPLTPALYARAPYEIGAGICEFPFQANQRSTIENGTLQLVQQGSNTVALSESQFVAETDQRATYIDEGETASISIRVYDKGKPAADGVQVLVSQYDVDNALMPQQLVELIDSAGDPSAGVVTVKNGVATVAFRPVRPGVCYLFFYPFTGSTLPQPENPGFASTADFYAVVRVLPFDNALEKDTPDSKLSFSFIYNQVLQTYDVIYPIMSQVRNLHDKNVVDAMAEQLKFAISLDTFQSTLYMPITRELSAGKRKLLQRYVNLLPNRVPPDPPTP